MISIQRTVSAALACTACYAASAQAQTVQLYGIVDMGLVFANNVSGTGAAGSPSQSTFRLESGNAQSSRLGFRGKEDLGGGYHASFLLEQGIAVDTGVLTAGGRQWGRSAYVGLGNANHEIRLGRQVTPLYEFSTMFDPVAPAKFAGPVFDAANIGRADSAVKYLGKFGGLDVRLEYGFGAEEPLAGSANTLVSVAREKGALVHYRFGRFAVGGALHRQYGTSVATRGDTNDHGFLGLTYEFEHVKLFAAYQKQKLDVAGVRSSNNLYWIGARFKQAAFTLTGALYVYNPGGGDNRSVMPSVLATYALSKRTDLYAHAAYLKNDSAAARAVVAQVNPGADQTAVTVGVRHRF